MPVLIEGAGQRQCAITAVIGRSDDQRAAYGIPRSELPQSGSVFDQRPCVSADPSACPARPLSQWVTVRPSVPAGEQSSGSRNGAEVLPLSARPVSRPRVKIPGPGRFHRYCVFKLPRTREKPILRGFGEPLAWVVGQLEAKPTEDLGPVCGSASSRTHAMSASLSTIALSSASLMRGRVVVLRIAVPPTLERAACWCRS
jgi:hypothetical protein